jgi:hypothetical protein
VTAPGPSIATCAGAAAGTLATCAAIERQGAFVIMPHKDLVPVNPPGGITDLLTGLRHFSRGHFGFGDVLERALETYQADRARSSPALRRARVTAGRNAVRLYAAALRQGPLQPLSPDLASDRIARFASLWSMPFDQAAAAMAVRVTADLRHYADARGLSFGAAAKASRDAALAHQVEQGPPFDPGADTLRLAILPVPPGGEQFTPVPTHLGIVSTDCDAQWLLIRLTALLRDKYRAGEYPEVRTAVTLDTASLAASLAAPRGLTGPDITGQLEPAVSARVWELEHGTEAAAVLGRAHGISGAPAYALDHVAGQSPVIIRAGHPGDVPWARVAPGDRPLMQAFGETEHVTPLNADHRQRLIHAYRTAYNRAAGHRPAAPARTAALSFPRDPHQFLPSLDPSDLIRQAAAQSGSRTPRPLRGL